MEFLITEDSPVKDIPILQMAIKGHILLAAIYRRGEIIYPNGSDVLMVGDRVVVVTTVKGLTDIKDILQ